MFSSSNSRFTVPAHRYLLHRTEKHCHVMGLIRRRIYADSSEHSSLEVSPPTKSSSGYNNNSSSSSTIRNHSLIFDEGKTVCDETAGSELTVVSNLSVAGASNNESSVSSIVEYVSRYNTFWRQMPRPPPYAGKEHLQTFTLCLSTRKNDEIETRYYVEEEMEMDPNFQYSDLAQAKIQIDPYAYFGTVLADWHGLESLTGEIVFSLAVPCRAPREAHTNEMNGTAPKKDKSSKELNEVLTFWLGGLRHKDIDADYQKGLSESKLAAHKKNKKTIGKSHQKKNLLQRQTSAHVDKDRFELSFKSFPPVITKPKTSIISSEKCSPIKSSTTLNKDSVDKSGKDEPKKIAVAEETKSKWKLNPLKFKTPHTSTPYPTVRPAVGGTGKSTNATLGATQRLQQVWQKSYLGNSSKIASNDSSAEYSGEGSSLTTPVAASSSTVETLALSTTSDESNQKDGSEIEIVHETHEPVARNPFAAAKPSQQAMDWSTMTLFANSLVNSIRFATGNLYAKCPYVGKKSKYFLYVPDSEISRSQAARKVLENFVLKFPVLGNLRFFLIKSAANHPALYHYFTDANVANDWIIFPSKDRNVHILRPAVGGLPHGTAVHKIISVLKEVVEREKKTEENAALGFHQK